MGVLEPIDALRQGGSRGPAEDQREGAPQGRQPEPDRRQRAELRDLRQLERKGGAPDVDGARDLADHEAVDEERDRSRLPRVWIELGIYYTLRIVNTPGRPQTD